jgi:GNAT superfamily N-acetyltransferase
MEAETACHGEYTISTDPSLLDLATIHEFLSTQAPWSRNIPLATVQESIAHSLCFGLFCQGQQIGFARVISDFATIAYLGDVFVLPAYRGQGLSKWLLQQVMAHPRLQSLRRWILLTADAHGLYQQFGWTEITDPSKWMEVHNPAVYAEK